MPSHSQKTRPTRPLSELTIIIGPSLEISAMGLPTLAAENDPAIRPVVARVYRATHEVMAESPKGMAASLQQGLGYLRRVYRQSSGPGKSITEVNAEAWLHSLFRTSRFGQSLQ